MTPRDQEIQKEIVRLKDKLARALRHRDTQLRLLRTRRAQVRKLEAAMPVMANLLGVKEERDMLRDALKRMNDDLVRLADRCQTYREEREAARDAAEIAFKDRDEAITSLLDRDRKILELEDRIIRIGSHGGEEACEHAVVVNHACAACGRCFPPPEDEVILRE